MVFSICRLVNMSRNLVQILMKDSAFCLNQASNVYLCTTQHTDCSLMHVLQSLGYKNLELLLRMRSPNKHYIMLKWGIFNVSVLVNEHGYPPFFISKLEFLYDKYSVDKVWKKIYCHFYFRGITLIKRVLISLKVVTVSGIQEECFYLHKDFYLNSQGYSHLLSFCLATFSD